MNVNNKVQILPRWAVKLIGIFVPILREMYEMLYQYDRDIILIALNSIIILITNQLQT